MAQGRRGRRAAARGVPIRSPAQPHAARPHRAGRHRLEGSLRPGCHRSSPRQGRRGRRSARTSSWRRPSTCGRLPARERATRVGLSTPAPVPRRAAPAPHRALHVARRPRARPFIGLGSRRRWPPRACDRPPLHRLRHRTSATSAAGPAGWRASPWAVRASTQPRPGEPQGRRRPASPPAPAFDLDLLGQPQAVQSAPRSPSTSRPWTATAARGGSSSPGPFRRGRQVCAGATSCRQTLRRASHLGPAWTCRVADRGADHGPAGTAGPRTSGPSAPSSAR